MLDIKFVRENPDIVKQNIKNKFQDKKLPLVDEVIELDDQNRKIKKEVESLRAEKNSLSKKIGGLMKEGKKEEAEEIKAKGPHHIQYCYYPKSQYGITYFPFPLTYDLKLKSFLGAQCNLLKSHHKLFFCLLHPLPQPVHLKL